LGTMRRVAELGLLIEENLNQLFLHLKNCFRSSAITFLFIVSHTDMRSPPAKSRVLSVRIKESRFTWIRFHYDNEP
jgi:hypothetical protein